EFVVWTLTPGTAQGRTRELPSNVSAVVEVPPPGDGPPAARRSRFRKGRGAGRVTDRDVERGFVPLFHELLDEFTGGGRFDPGRFARLLSAFRAHFQVWDYRDTWRSRAVWDAFRELAVSPAQVLAEGDGGG